MPGIRPSLNAEKEIRSDPNYSSIVRVLKEVKRAGTLDLDSNKNLIAPPQLYKSSAIRYSYTLHGRAIRNDPIGKASPASIEVTRSGKK